MPGPDPLDLPRVLCDWEPAYPVAEYRSHDADFPSPPPELGGAITDVGSSADRVPHTGVARTLRDLVHPWTADGEATSVAVRGSAADAIGVIDGPEVRLSEVELSTGLAWLGWAGASGGAHGRRRGAAAGRLDTWMVLAELLDLSEHWPPDPIELGERARRLRWFVWDATGIGPSGWVLRVAVEDPDRGLSFALRAYDPA